MPRAHRHRHRQVLLARAAPMPHARAEAGAERAVRFVRRARRRGRSVEPASVTLRVVGGRWQAVMGGWSVVVGLDHEGDERLDLAH